MKWLFIDTYVLDYDIDSPWVRPLGGSQSAVCYLARALARLGEDVTTVTGTTHPRQIAGVRCLHHNDCTPQLLAEPSTIVVVVNGPADMGLRLAPFVAASSRLALWAQHAPDQPAVRGLRQPDCAAAWDLIVCVSDWQREMYCREFGVPPERIDVLRNAVAPVFHGLFADREALGASKAVPARLAYTSTPFRGLDVLLSCFAALRQRHAGCELDVFSSMLVYGDEESQDAYRALYDQCRRTPGVCYHGSQAQPELASRLARVSVLAYPNTFAETSCIAAVEAMAAGAVVVTSRLGALPETCGSWGYFVEPMGSGRSRQDYERDFVRRVDEVLASWQADPQGSGARQFEQVQAICAEYDWNRRAVQWQAAAQRWIS